MPLWRDRDTIQVGVDPRRAVALSGAGAAAALIGLLDGSRDRAQVRAAAADHGIPAAVTERVLAVLAASGVLVDFPAALLRELPAELRTSLLGELAGTSLARLDSDGGAQTLARRAAAVVQVSGTGTIAVGITDVLTASGVAAQTRPLTPADLAAGPSATLVVLAGRHPAGTADELRRRRMPHLSVAASEAIGIVGPLVRPGITACLRCLDLTRAARDPAWPLILAQLDSRQAGPAACDAVLSHAVEAQAAAQALQFIDVPTATGPAENATLELVQPGWHWRRRSWPAHPACTCLAAPAA